MNTRYAISHRILAMLLALVLVLGMAPRFTLQADAVAFEEKVADPNTMDGWQKYFGTAAQALNGQVDTEYAGAVWTDKSVFTDASAFPGVTLSDESNFLVALSAIAASEKISGTSASPVDTMLVLDLSNSMDTAQAVPDMVDATNDAIDALLKMNPNSRVGVVLYSGRGTTGTSQTSTATVILPLARYTGVQVTDDNGTWWDASDDTTVTKYLTYSGNSNDTTVSVQSGLTYENSTTGPSGSKQTNGGTYIQNGLYQAWQEFDSKIQSSADTVVNGVKRTPVVVLMSDGAPTVGTYSYNSVGASNTGNGSSTNNTITFLTQLTAAWVKGKLSAEYGSDAKFYTLGMGSGLGANGTAVLYPQGSGDTLSAWWSDYLAAPAGSNVTASNDSWRDPQTITVYRDAAVTTKNYVDNYWYSETSGGMIDAFKQIVGEIELQATHSVTLVEGGDHDLSGYVTFEDELGEFMEVKKVDGLQLGNTLYTGKLFMDSLDNMTDAAGNPTDYGNEFVATVRERLGIDTSTAQKLINDAFTDGQLGEDAGDGVVRNYIGWYGDENNNFVGFWDKDYTLEHVPAGAVYANKSYGYLGAESTEAGASDMMHVIIMVHTNISNGHQSVIYKIPASLLPTVQYEVELSGTDLSTVESVTRTGADPLRLIFEVGLRSDINEVNMEEKLAEAIASGDHHVHKNADGTYSFYTNRWGSGDGSHEIDYTQPNSHLVTSSHFHPAVDNKRFYYTQDTLLYVSDGNGGYTPYVSATAPAAADNDDFFFGRVYYTEGKQKVTEYLGVTPQTVAQAAANGVQDGNRWFIPAGTPILDYSRVQAPKSTNNTDTLTYSFYPTIVVDTQDGTTPNEYNMYEFLGNNGKLTVAPATGLKVTKEVAEAVAGAPTDFTFTVVLSQAESGLQVTDSDGNALVKGTDWDTTDNKTVTLTLADGESAVLSGLTAGTTYTVTETGDALDYYTVTATGASGTLQAHAIAEAVLTNSPILYGDLIITKEVVHPFTSDPAALADVEFAFEVILEGMAGKTVKVAGVDTVVGADDKLTGLILKNDDSVTVSGIVAGTEYQVIETPAPGFGLDTQLSSGMTGTVPGNGLAEADVVNRYPVVVKEDLNINITVNKNVVGTYTGEETFTFLLERLNDDGQTYTQVQELHIANGSSVMSVVYDLALSVDDLGSHHYRLTEKAPAQPTPGMTYSAARGLFRIDVTDENMDGDLEISVVSEGNVTVTGSGNTYALAMTFTNTYSVNGTNVPVKIQKVMDNNTGAEMSPVGYTFGFYLKNADGTVASEPSFIRTSGPTGVAELNIPITDAAQNGTVYVIKEIVPDVPVPGMTYAPQVYELTIQVTDNASQLEATATMSPAAVNGAAVFTNTYRLSPAELTLSGSKAFTGREPVGNEFSFRILETDATFTNALPGGVDQTVSAGKGSFSFHKITYTTVGTHHYLITEVAGTAGGVTYDPARYHVTVHVAPNGDKLATTTHVTKVGAGVVVNASADASISGFDFANSYTVSGTTQLELAGSKTLTGRRLNAGEFSFVLREGTAEIARVSNLPDGTFQFPTIVYGVDDLGEHTYTVSEVQGTLGGVTYAGNSYTFTVKVVDNGQGGLAVEGAASIPALLFENTYYAQPVTVTLSGDKTWTNTDTGAAVNVGDGDFTFVLYESDESFSTLGAEAGSGSTLNGRFSISKTYSHGQQGIYYYVLREQIGDDETVTYDPAIYNVKINVVDAGVGQLSAMTTIQKVGVSGTFTETDFHNYYTPAPAQLTIQGTKTITGDISRIPVDGEFDFQLFQTDDTFTVAAGAAPVQTVSNEGGMFTFDALEFENSDTYYYVVREFIPAQATGNVYNGMAYDTVDTLVTVQVEDVNGQLTATASYTKGGSTVAGPLFTNTYDAHGDITFTVNGQKAYKDQNGNDKPIDRVGQFLFTMYDSNGYHVATVPSRLDGSFEFGAIHFHADTAGDYVFTVKENAPQGGTLDGVTYDHLKEYTVTVNVVDNGSGTLTAGTVTIVETGTTTPVTSMNFTNTYEAEPVDVTIRGNKVLTGRRLQAGEFTMELIENGGVIQRATNTVLGGFVFDTITYTEAGDHVYTVREQIPANATNGEYKGVTYDTTGYTVTVKVEDDGKGALTATVTYPQVPDPGHADTGLVIRNSYQIKEFTSFDLHGTKTYLNTVTGQPKELPTGADAFTFLLTDGGSYTEQVTTTDGSFTFQNIPLQTLGQHTFTLSEVEGTLGGVTYDSRSYTVTIMTYDNGDGTMRAGAPSITLNGQTTQIAFRNTYSVTGPAVFDVEGTKAWVNVTDPANPENLTMQGGEFTFELYEGAKKLATTTNDATGKFVFEDVQLDKLGVYDLTVKEVLPTGGVKDGTTYDSTGFGVQVTVSDNGLGGMTAQVAYPVTGATLINEYKVTGTGETQIKGHKAMIGKNLNGSEFTFELYETDATFAIGQNQQPVDTQVNGGADHGSFAFDLSYTPDQLGDHYYVVKEQTPDGGIKDGISYDSRQFHVSVKVSDNGVGGITVEEPVITLNGAPAELRFLNAYSVTGVAHVDIAGEKTLHGRKLIAGAFTFELYDENGQLVESVTNDADGKFLFDDVPLTELGTYTYTVKEKAGDEKGMAYDDTVFQVELKVSDNGVGGKKAQILSIKAAGAAAELSFVNTYTPADITVGVAVKKTVQSKTEDTIGADGFQFVLTDAEGKELASVVSDKNGDAGFNLTYTASDIGKTYVYLVKETNTRKTGVVYDTTVHELTVAITANDKGDLVATVNGAAEAVRLDFVNTYEKPVSPVTGDTFDLIFISSVMLLSVTGLVVLLIARKKKEEIAE